MLKILAVVCLVMSSTAYAGAPENWGHWPDDVKGWFPTVMQPGWEGRTDQGHSCCGEADAYVVQMTGQEPNGDFDVVIPDGRGIMPNGQKIIVPHDKLQWHYANPIGEIILFVSTSGTVYCLVPQIGG